MEEHSIDDLLDAIFIHVKDMYRLMDRKVYDRFTDSCMFDQHFRFLFLLIRLFRCTQKRHYKNDCAGDDVGCEGRMCPEFYYSRLVHQLGDRLFSIDDKSTQTESLRCTPTKMCALEERLKTFENKWSIDYIKPLDLAQAGFYYTDEEDIVKCPYCLISLHDWKPMDVPLLDHVRYAPQCRYLQRQLISNEKMRNDGYGSVAHEEVTIKK